jgi:hypothetical protein
VAGSAIGLHPSARGVLRDLPQAGRPRNCRGVIPMPQPGEALTDRDGDGTGDALACHRGELTGQALGTKRDRWLSNLRAATAAGKRFERVRIVPEPLTDYLRFEIRGTRYNVDFGEDIRYLNRYQADTLDLPAHDFWVFDASRLVLMYFTADDRHLGSELITDPDMVERHERWLDLAFGQATPHRQYLAADPSRQGPPIERA